MRLGWLPWKFVIRRIARAHGFLDPIVVLSRLRGFTQPSEVAEPVELLRAGVVLHARGLINSRVIQHNLDWLWPYWVERQFDPKDDAFVPRAFSITHINMTNRNWTAVGLPDLDALPIVDPRGLVTPHLDGWSLDAWVVADDGRMLLPSREKQVVQTLRMEADGLAVTTDTKKDDLLLAVEACVTDHLGAPALRMRMTGVAEGAGWLVLSLRPYNPEGVQFIHKAHLTDDGHGWRIHSGLLDAGQVVRFDQKVSRHLVSDYARGDVHIHLNELENRSSGKCDVGMLTAAAMFRIEPGSPTQVTATVPLTLKEESRHPAVSWTHALAGTARLDIPDARYRFLYDAALRTLILHSPDDVYPGPYTYKRFWFRDAAFIVHALLCAGLTDRAERTLDRFPSRQKRDGYFLSQEGEWDANGEALWIMDRFCRMTGTAPKAAWHKAIKKGAEWITKKRLPEDGGPFSGLLPAGFSAEHLGPNDYYYWDDFWGVAGLYAADHLLSVMGEELAATRFADGAGAFSAAIDTSLETAKARLGRAAMPAAPTRRLDAGMIGSICAGYPLKLFAPDDARLTDSADYLMENCFVNGGFFQDMIHSGLNPYLTLHVAQVLLRAGDPRYLALMDTVADLASPTGQWPEAIHPHTLGGCMGDGQHVWAAAEWLILLRNLFVREEAGGLILASGIPERWRKPGETLRFGPAPTEFGPVTVTVDTKDEGVTVSWEARWHGEAPPITVALPGLPAVTPRAGTDRVELQPEAVS